MRFFKKHIEGQETFEDNVLLLSRSLSQMRSYVHKIVRILKNSEKVERKMGILLKQISSPGGNIELKTHSLKNFYTMLSMAKTAQGEAKHALSTLKLKEHHIIIEDCLKKFREANRFTKEAKKILKSMAK